VAKLLIYLVNPQVPRSRDEEKKGLYPPLGLLYIATVLKERGYEVKIYELNVESSNKLIHDVQREQPDVVGITVHTVSFPIVKSLIKELRQSSPSTTIVCGGPHATLCPEDFINIADIVVRGEGEEVARDLPNLLHAIKELKTRAMKTTLVVQGASPNIDELPIPDRALLNTSYYGENIGVLVTSRGCPFNCLFCCVRYLFSRAYRARSPMKVLQEVLYLVDRFNVHRVKFVDDEFTVVRSRVREICQLLKEYGVGVTWSLPNGIRVDTVDERLLRDMSEAGCDLVWFGIESGSERVLKYIRKGIDLEKARGVIKIAKDYGIRVGGFFMIGAPGETLDEFKKIIDLIPKLDLDYIHFSIATPYPNTEFWNWVQVHGRFITLDYQYFEKTFIFETPDYTIRDRLRAVELLERELGYYELSDDVKIIEELLTRT